MTQLRDFARRLIDDPTYQANVKARALAGTLPPDLETFLWEVAELPTPSPNQSRTLALVRPLEKVSHD